MVSCHVSAQSADPARAERACQPLPEGHVVIGLQFRGVAIDAHGPFLAFGCAFGCTTPELQGVHVPPNLVRSGYC